MSYETIVKSDAPLYLLPGMTPDDHVFSRLLPLLPNCTVINWLDPNPNEPITAYAQRLAQTIPTSECFIGGVSFGGIVAIELSRIIQPHGCFLISSIRDQDQLPPWFRIWRFIAGNHCQQILNAIGHFAIAVPKRVRTRSTTRITKLAGPAGAWHRWATSAVLQWKPDRVPLSVPVCHIHGDRDTTFPVRYTDPDVIIRDGGHVLPLTHPTEVANVMLAVMNRST